MFGKDWHTHAGHVAYRLLNVQSQDELQAFCLWLFRLTSDLRCGHLWRWLYEDHPEAVVAAYRRDCGDKR